MRDSSCLLREFPGKLCFQGGTDFNLSQAMGGNVPRDIRNLMFFQDGSVLGEGTTKIGYCYPTLPSFPACLLSIVCFSIHSLIK